MKLFYLFSIFILASGHATAQLLISTAGTPQTIDFNGYTGTGFTPTPTAGQLSSLDWQILGMSDGPLLFGATGVGGDFARGFSIGGVTTGGAYSFDNGSGGSLGVQPGASDFNPGSFTLRIQNTTGAVMNQIVLDYEIWVLNDQGRSSSFNFLHSSDNATYTAVPALNFVSPEAADATPSWGVSPRSAVITGVTINDGDFYYLRWSSADAGGGGSRDELALDNVSIELNAVSDPTLSASTLLLSGFEQIVGTPSAEQSFEVSGVNLTDDLELNVTGDYEISVTSGAGFTNSLILSPVAGEVASTVIYTRLNGLTVASPSNGQVALTSIGAAAVQVNLEGEIIPIPDPALTGSSNLLSGFIQFIGSPSPEQSFTVSGEYLVDDVTVTVVSGDYEIADNAAGPFANTVVFSPTAGTLAATSVFVRLNGTALATPSNGSIEVISSGATTLTVVLEGEIVPVPNSIIIDFEGAGETKTAYGQGIVNLSGLDWELNEAVIGTLANDFKNGLRSARLRGRNGSYMQMMQDKPNGLGEISFLYREYGTDANQQPWNVEYSTDGGIDWIFITEITGTNVVQSYSAVIEVPGDVRVRFVLATSPGTTGDRRLNIDDIELTNYIPDPIVNATPVALTNFIQVVGAPSAEQSFSVSGDFLVGDVSVSVVLGEYEIADNVAGPYTNSVLLFATNGTVPPTTLYVRLNGTNPANPELGLIEVTSLGAVTNEVTLNGIISLTPIPQVFSSVTGLSGFSQQLPGTSAEQVFEVSGINLDGDIDLTVSGDFELSLTSGAGFLNAISIPAVAGEVAATVVYVRLNGAAASALVQEEITVTSFNVLSNVLVDLEGEILPVPTPVISASPLALSGFSQLVGTPSAEQTFEVSGVDLTADVDLVVAGNYEISLTSGAGFTNVLVLPVSGGLVAASTIYVRLNGTVAAPLVEEVVTLSSVGASNVEIELTGEIVQPVSPEVFVSTNLIDGFVQYVGTPSPAESFVLSASDLEEDVLITVNGDYEISLDQLTGYVTALSIPEVSGGIAPTTIYVRLNGAAVQDPANGILSFISSNAVVPSINLEGVILECSVNTGTTVSGLTISANNAFATSYVWIDCGNGNAVIPGQTGQSFTATENGSYAVIIADGVCSETSDCVTITTVGFEYPVLTGLRVYPNPVKDFFILDGLNDASSIRVYDALGRIVFQSETLNASLSVHSSNWENGVYTLVVINESGETALKIVK